MKGKRRPAAQRILFAKVGWMLNYAGMVPGDERPLGGGGYNKTAVGSEIYNFQPVNGRYYGFFQAPGSKLNFKRIDPTTGEDAETMKSVLVVLVAPRPEGGQVIVGWYGNATLLRKATRPTPGRPKEYEHLIIAPVASSFLIKPELRDFPIPKKGGLGQRNVCYPYEADGTRKNAPWMVKALAYIDEYEAPNLAINPETAAEEESAAAVEAALARAGGQGFARTPAERKAIEQHSMTAATRYFKARGYRVEDVSKTKPYDLRCRKNGREVHVEVKGTTTPGETIILTKNEVKHAARPKSDCILFILHSIRLTKGNARGGKRAIHEPWRPEPTRLTPITYTYRI